MSHVITVKQYAKYRFYTGTTWFYITKKIVNKSCISFLGYLTTKFQGSIYSDTSIAPTTEVLTTAIFILLMAENKYKGGVASSGMLFIPSLVKMLIWNNMDKLLSSLSNINEGLQCQISSKFVH